MGCGGSDSPSRAGPRGWGEDLAAGQPTGGFRRLQDAVSVGKKKKKLNCPAPSNRCVSHRKLGRPGPEAVPLLPLRYPPPGYPAVGPGRSRPGWVSRQGRWWRGEEPGFLHSTSPASSRHFPAAASASRGRPVTQEELEVRSEEGPLRASAGVSRSAGGQDRVLRRSQRALRVQSRLREAPVGCGAARGCEIHPPLGRFQAAEGEAGGGRRACPQAGDPTGGDRSTPALRPSERGASSSPRFLLGFPRLLQAQADPLAWPVAAGAEKEWLPGLGTPFLSF